MLKEQFYIKVHIRNIKEEQMDLKLESIIKKSEMNMFVPYKKFLLKKLNCHINVEICSTIQVFKYLYKYIYKGHDSASIELNPSERFNEIRRYLTSRYVGPSKSAWREFKFCLHKETPNVYRLPVHLENHQSVVFNDNYHQH